MAERKNTTVSISVTIYDLYLLSQLLSLEGGAGDTYKRIREKVKRAETRILIKKIKKLKKVSSGVYK